MGYNFDTSSVSSEITAVIAEIGKYGPAINVGTVDTESMLPKFLEALDAAGMNKIIEENQRQLDAWLADQAE
jgi:putative aldouronate transport system substrate-binding protein